MVQKSNAPTQPISAEGFEVKVLTEPEIEGTESNSVHFRAMPRSTAELSYCILLPIPTRAVALPH